MNKQIKVLYVGDAGLVFGPMIFESPFVIETKDAYIRNWAQYLIDSLKKYNDISITHMSSVQAYRDFPKDYDKLREYDVVFLSDVSSEVLRFYPEFFPIEELREVTLLKEKEYVGMPDRLELVKRFVEEGGALIMAGGWYSFSGRFGNGAWYRTPIAEILPVQISEVDDRVETPTGVMVKVVDNNHEIVRGIPWDTCPPFLGYNKLKLKDDSLLLATIGESNDPLIVLSKRYDERVMVFTSDPVLHWGINFVKWEYYPEFWYRVFNWLRRK
ncbi:MAG: glutamine amidotransferase [Thermoproteota archaeon]